MKDIPKLSIRFSDSYKAALLEIKESIESFRKLDDLYDSYMVKEEIKNATIQSNINKDEYKIDLDENSLYLNISDLKTIKKCNRSVLNLLKYEFNDSDLKLFVHITNDNNALVFIQAPLSHIANNARYY